MIQLNVANYWKQKRSVNEHENMKPSCLIAVQYCLNFSLVLIVCNMQQRPHMSEVNKPTNSVTLDKQNVSGFSLWCQQLEMQIICMHLFILVCDLSNINTKGRLWNKFWFPFSFSFPEPFCYDFQFPFHFSAIFLWFPISVSVPEQFLIFYFSFNFPQHFWFFSPLLFFPLQTFPHFRPPVYSGQNVDNILLPL